MQLHILIQNNGDGFHYTSIKVPDGSTPETLGLYQHTIITKEDMLDKYNITV
jgi:hypothetical protein